MNSEYITKEEFIRFEKVRQSGVTNMFDRDVVVVLAGISKDVYLGILANYQELKSKYLSK